MSKINELFNRVMGRPTKPDKYEIALRFRDKKGEVTLPIEGGKPGQILNRKPDGTTEWIDLDMTAKDADCGCNLSLPPDDYDACMHECDMQQIRAWREFWEQEELDNDEIDKEYDEVPDDEKCEDFFDVDDRCDDEFGRYSDSYCACLANAGYEC